MIEVSNKRIQRVIKLFAINLISLCMVASGRTIYVDPDATNISDGSSWANAYWCLQDALSNAQAGDEIRVAYGTYKPDRRVAISRSRRQITASGDRAVAFHLINGVALRGGYAGYGEPDPNARDTEKFETILSGDQNGDDGPSFTNTAENSYHVVTGSGIDQTALLDGFVIIAGNANGPVPYDRGSGMYNSQSSPTVTNCTFTKNYSDSGGSIYNDNSAPTITSCTFSGNSAEDKGGGIYNDGGNLTLIDCVFIENTSVSNGAALKLASSYATITGCRFFGNMTLGGSSANAGAIDNNNSSPVIRDCTFVNNSSPGFSGGAIVNYGNSNPTVVNCVFQGNSAGAGGGAMFNWMSSSPLVVNCIFAANSANRGGGMANNNNCHPKVINCTFVGNRARDTGGGTWSRTGSNPGLSNCILWENTDNNGMNMGESAQIDSDESSTITVNHCDIQGLTPGLGGTGNIDDRPFFVDADGVDNIIGTEDDNMRLLADSPCIDAGDNSVIPEWLVTDLDGNPRIVNDTVDMGAYEADVTPAPKIHYVDADAQGNNDGSSWSNAFLCLQDALAVAQFGDEIRVANGVYKPDQRTMMRRDEWQVVSSSDWTATFQLIDGAVLKGGYAGFGELDPDARNTEQYKSVLSGDLNDDDDPQFSNIWDNSYQVVTASGTNWTTVLDGFTITGGNADGPFPYNHGGGIYNVEGSPTLIDCAITENSTIENGGGMYNSFHSDPVLIDCTFSNNSGFYGGGMENENSDPALLNCILKSNSADELGGGMCNYRSNPILANCTFIENSAIGGGGMSNVESEPILSDCTFNRNSSTDGGSGILNGKSTPTLLSCIFSDNSTPSNGGGMYNGNSQPSLMNCIFSGNSAGINGGGMENFSTSHPILLNCTFSNNRATQAGGGISSSEEGLPMLINCILWSNSDESGTGAYSSQIRGQAEVVYSCIQDSIGVNPWPGEGNINSDPLFANPENRDYHLKSQMGRWNPISQGWMIDPMSSPCIDKGDPSDPVGLERLPNGNRINMGAYGGTTEASLSPIQPPTVNGKASNPYPVDGAENVDINVRLNWTPGIEGALYNIYLGTDFDQVKQSNRESMVAGQQSNTNYDPGILNYNQTYYWKIDEVIGGETIIVGDVWFFTTTSSPGIPKGRTCFTAGTGVWINGALVPISKITPGQSISDINNPGKVQEVQEHSGTYACYDVLLESGNCIGVAENHYFLAESGQWISLQNLKKGTKLKTAKGTVGIINIIKRPIPYEGKVFNLKINGSDRYLVGKDAIVVSDY